MLHRFSQAGAISEEKRVRSHLFAKHRGYQQELRLPFMVQGVIFCRISVRFAKGTIGV